MNSLTRGIRNAFRNSIRAGAVVVILALGVGLSLIMLISLFAVNDRIDSVRSSVANTITVTPAGIRGFQGGGELLTQDNAENIAGLDHVADVEQIFTERLTPGTDTTLQSAIEPGSFGRRAAGSDGSASQSAPPDMPAGAQGMPGMMTLPVMISGVENDASQQGILQGLGIDKIEIVSGQDLGATASTEMATATSTSTGQTASDTGSTAHIAMVGTQLAAKNNLKTDSVFTAFGTEVKVAGIYETGNQFVDSSLIMPIDSLRKLSSSEGQINTLIVTTDSSANIQAVTDEIKSALGKKVDVVSQLDTTNQSLSSLEGVKTIARYSLAGSLVSAAVILFLIMLMIVRERRQEIGVLKAIGASNLKIVKQFISESLTFTVLAGTAGVVIGIVFSNPVLEVMVRNASSETGQTAQGPFGGGGMAAGPGAPMGPPGGPVGPGRFISAQQNVLENLNALVDYRMLLYGLMAALLIAVVGSAIPAYSISKIRPAEAMRGE